MKDVCTSRRPVALIIMDGWGIRDDGGQRRGAGQHAQLRHLERTRALCSMRPGWPWGCRGADGQLRGRHPPNLGAGLCRLPGFHCSINMAIEDGSLVRNDVVAAALEGVRRGTKLHLIGPL